MKEIIITEEYLKSTPSHVFVFGDNDLRVGSGGAAALRHFPNTYGFITKRKPTHKDEDFYNQADYNFIYIPEILLLRTSIVHNPEKTYLISKVGAGLANRYGIWEAIIEPTIKPLLSDLKNVRFLW